MWCVWFDMRYARDALRAIGTADVTSSSDVKQLNLRCVSCVVRTKWDTARRQCRVSPAPALRLTLVSSVVLEIVLYSRFDRTRESHRLHPIRPGRAGRGARGGRRSGERCTCSCGEIVYLAGHFHDVVLGRRTQELLG